MKVFIKALFVAVVLLLTNVDSWAQCAMCRSTLEANMSNGETANFAAGLNFGILYLFFTPYLLLAVIAFFWYRNSRKNVKNLRPSGNRSW
jgi:hypothetical protein